MADFKIIWNSGMEMYIEHLRSSKLHKEKPFLSTLMLHYSNFRLGPEFLSKKFPAKQSLKFHCRENENGIEEAESNEMGKANFGCTEHVHHA